MIDVCMVYTVHAIYCTYIGFDVIEHNSEYIYRVQCTRYILTFVHCTRFTTYMITVCNIGIVSGFEQGCFVIQCTIVNMLIICPCVYMCVYVHISYTFFTYK